MNQTLSKRPRRSSKARAEILQRSEVTPLSLAEFCRNEGISVSTLYAWRNRRQETKMKPAFSPITLKAQRQPPPREAAAPDASPAIEIVLASGHMIRVPSGPVDPTQLRMIVRALGGAA